MYKHLVERKIATDLVFEGRVIKVRIDEVLLPNGKNTTREVVEHPGAVSVVPIRDDGTIVMVRQYRHAAGKIMLEIPAGKLDKGENPDSCASRELEEETGYRASHIRKLASVYTTPGFTDEIMYIYAAEGLVEASRNTDEDEFIDIVYYSPEEVKDLIKSGQIEDAKTMLGLCLSGVIS